MLFSSLRKKEYIMGEFTDKVKGNAKEAIGKTKEAIGDATDNKSLEAKGKAQQMEGKGDKLKGSVKGALGDDI